jgi:hypothetical protein
MSKAWIVDDHHEENSVVVFHSHGLAARRLGANEFDGDFDAVKCRRAKEFDEYAAQGFVPPLVLLKNGWWFTCSGCFERVSEEDSCVIEAGPNTVFCSKECQEKKLTKPEGVGDDS